MQRKITSEKIPVLLWADDLDEEALQQTLHLANLPWAFHHVAIMADAHVGYGMPIGGVLATIGVVIPNAVGVDIGCGMQAVRTDLTEVARPQLKKILAAARATIPLGFAHHPRPRSKDLLPDPGDLDLGLPVVAAEFENARRQVGTLGGGNHFIEIQQDSDGYIWLMIHSGSRNLGYKVAGHYNKLAVGLAEKLGPRAVPKAWQLAGLPLDSTEGQRYIQEMVYCMAFARANRAAMMAMVQTIVTEVTGCDQFEVPLDVAHNYAAQESHFGRVVWVHRKGAIRALSGELGIIPGSQGSHSAIVAGLGNPESFHSCAHGAGRVLGRKQAQQQLDLHAEIARLDQHGIVHTLRSRRDLEEAPGAYKDIDRVLVNQRDLITVVQTLRPLAVLKG